MRNAWLYPPFLLCAGLLAAVAVGDGMLADYLRVVIHKEALHPRKPLTQINRSAIMPYQFTGAESVDPATEEALGTREYIFWKLLDTSIADETDPRRYVSVAVTYYTGKTDLLPHTPDVCMKGSGYQPKQPHENKVLPVSTLPPDQRQLPIRLLTFQKSGLLHKEEISVVYTFHVNGSFMVDVRDLMRALNNPTSRHAYYAKVEVSFGDARARPSHPSRQDTEAAAARVFETLLPVLLRDHFPDWAASEKAPHTSDDPSPTESP